MAVETKRSYIKEIKLPGDLAEGTYTLQVTNRYGDFTASASQEFYIVHGPFDEEPKDKVIIYFKENDDVLFLVLASIITVLIFFVAYLYHKMRFINQVYGKNRISGRNLFQNYSKKNKGGKKWYTKLD